MHQRGLHTPLRWAYFVLGCMMVVLGIIGAFLPVMPTTVFLLMALACFSKSSPRFEQWLLQHPRFGASLRAWRQHKAVPIKAKWAACLGMLLGLGILIFISTPRWVVLLVAGIELLVAIYLLRRPSAPLETESEPSANSSSDTTMPVHTASLALDTSMPVHTASPAPDTALAEVTTKPGLAASLPELKADQASHPHWKSGLLLSLLVHLGLLGYFAANWNEPTTSTARESQQLAVTMLQAAAPEVPVENKVAPKVTQAATKQAPKAAEPTPKAVTQPSESPKPVETSRADSTLSAVSSAQPKTSEQSAETGPLNKANSVAAAPISAPAAPQQAAGGSNSWEGKILARLERFRRYPTAARMRGDEGVAYLRIKMNREGQVLMAKLERSSGFAALDKAALEAVERAAPLPRIPPERPDEAELMVPFEFFIK